MNKFLIIALAVVCLIQLKTASIESNLRKQILYRIPKASLLSSDRRDEGVTSFCVKF